MREHEVNCVNKFIMGWYADDTSFCDKFLNLYKSNLHNTTKGKIGIGSAGVVDLSVKDSNDLQMSVDSLKLFGYSDILEECKTKYITKYPDVQCAEDFKILSSFFIQNYPPGGGFKIWHKERGSSKLPSLSRHLVFMTYLNDVRDGGGTEFLYQGVKIRADKGLTLMWPADWTFTHRGVVSLTEEKTIITGWYNLENQYEVWD